MIYVNKRVRRARVLPRSQRPDATFGPAAFGPSPDEARYTFSAIAAGGYGLELRRSVLVPYSAEGMFDLIEKAEAYPEFLPWCTHATILERSDEWVAARIDFSYLHVRFGFQTRNPKRRPEWLQVRLVEGPFRRFLADWHLTPLGTQGCKIDFDLSYEISDGILDKVAVRAVDIVSRSMLDAFVKRAEATLTANAPELTAAKAPEPRPDTPPHPNSTASETAMTPIDPQLHEAVRASPLAAEMNAEQVAVLTGLLNPSLSRRSRSWLAKARPTTTCTSSSTARSVSSSTSALRTRR